MKRFLIENVYLNQIDSDFYMDFEMKFLLSLWSKVHDEIKLDISNQQYELYLEIEKTYEND
jgi:hypothetical protein